MNRTLGSALIASTVATALTLSASLANAQTSRQYCQTYNGHLVCKEARGSAPANGARPYEIWRDGSPARAPALNQYPSASPDASQFPQSFGAYNNLYGIGR